MSSHFFRIKPGSQGKFRLAQNLGSLNSFHRLKFGLHNPDQIVRDVIRGQILAVESYYHGTDVFAGRYTNHRLLRFLGQLVEHRVDLGVNFGKRRVRIVVETHVRGDGADALGTR